MLYKRVILKKAKVLGVVDMARIITFFNHKGGVGKTTLAYNVAWGLSQVGKRVLMIDGDPQCNLTEVSIEDVDDLGGQSDLFSGQSDFDLNKHNIYEYFKLYIEPTPKERPQAARLYEKKTDLNLLAGSVHFAELEETISLALANIGALSHVPESTYMALQSLGENVDFIILDLSPALSATNQLFLMLSDYFIVPVNPSIFSRQALENLNQIFRLWNRKLSSFDIFSRKIKDLPKMLGIVCQNYRPYSRANEENTTSAKRFEARLAELNNQATLLAKDLSAFGMALTEVEFLNAFSESQPYRIANFPDYNQLGVVSESEKIPVNGLTINELKKHVLNTPQYQEKIKDFNSECKKVVDGLLEL